MQTCKIKVLVVGDSHGNREFIRRIFEVARNDGADMIIQVGDFGYGWKPTSQAGGVFWQPGMKDDETFRFEQTVARLAERNAIPFYFLDGNHEQFDLLATDAGDIAGRLPVQLDTYFFYLPRGCEFNIGSTRALSFGGARSIDRNHRVEGRDWWAAEMPTKKQQDDVLDTDYDGRIEIIFSHDAPNNGVVNDENLIPDALSKANREWMGALCDHVRPRYLIHGHYHHRYTSRYTSPTANVVVVGLGYDMSERFADSFVELILGEEEDVAH